MYSILVAGAGYTGSRIAKYFKNKNQKVAVLNREPLPELAGLGIQTVSADLTRPETLRKIPPAHFIVVAVGPDQRAAREGEPRPAGRDPESYRKLYVEGVGNFLNALASNPRPCLVVYLSSCRVYGSAQYGVIDEGTEPVPDCPWGKILLEAEQQVLQSGLASVVFRLSGIYGPGRNRLKRFRENRWPEPHPEKTMNMIHVEDIVNAMPILFKKSEPGQIWLGVDNGPVRETVFYDWLSQKLGKPYPRERFLRPPAGEAGPAGPDRAYQNHRLKSLGFSFQFPTFREGYASILQTES